MRRTKPLTDKQVANIKDGQKLHDGDGLRIERKGDSRRFTFTFTHPDTRKRHEMPVGSYPLLSLKAAREKRTEYLNVLDLGGDPRKPRGEPAADITFRQDMDAYYEIEHRLWRSLVHRANWRNKMENHAAAIMATPTALLTHQDIWVLVMGGTAPLWLTQHPSALVLLGQVRAVIDKAMKLDPERFPNGNPCMRASARLPKGVRTEKDVKHHAAMAWEVLPGFYARLDQRPEREARALQWMLLNGCSRSAEILQATRGEVTGDLWVCERTKNINARTNRQTPEAMAILAQCPDNGALFPAKRPGKRGPDGVWKAGSGFMERDCMRKLLLAMGEKLTVHGFRTSFTGWVRKNHRAMWDEMELLLDHKITGRLGSAYDRETLLDERYALCQLWAAFLQSEMTKLRLVA